MENISEYVKGYLVSNRSVEIAGLGRFSTEQMGAQIHPIIHEFIPPQSLLLFEENQPGTTTPAFAGFVADKTDTTIEEAFEEIQKFSNNIAEQLRFENSFFIEQFGTFRRNPDHTLTFEASDQVQLNMNAFGMPSFTLQKQDTEKYQHAEPEKSIQETVPKEINIEPEIIHDDDTLIPEEQENVMPVEPEPTLPVEQEATYETENISFQTENEDNVILTSPQPDQEILTDEPKENEPVHTPVVRKKRRSSLVWLLILFILAAVVSGTYFTGYWNVIREKFNTLTAKNETTNRVKENQGTTVSDETSQFNEQNQGSVTETNKDPIVADSVPDSKSIVSSSASEQQSGIKYYIVADCYINLYLAEMRVKQLQDQGFRASLQGKTSQGLYIVAYSDFSDKAIAETELQSIRQTINKNAWLLMK